MCVLIAGMPLAPATGVHQPDSSWEIDFDRGPLLGDNPAPVNAFNPGGPAQSAPQGAFTAAKDGRSITRLEPVPPG